MKVPEAHSRTSSERQGKRNLMKSNSANFAIRMNNTDAESQYIQERPSLWRESLTEPEGQMVSLLDDGNIHRSRD